MSRYLQVLIGVLVAALVATSCSGDSASPDIDPDIELALSFLSSVHDENFSEPLARLEFVDNRRATEWWSESEIGDTPETRWWIQRMQDESSQIDDDGRLSNVSSPVFDMTMSFKHVFGTFSMMPLNLLTVLLEFSFTMCFRYPCFEAGPGEAPQKLSSSSAWPKNCQPPV